MWVDSEYAGELAVLSAWLGALTPWNVQPTSVEVLGGEASTLYVRVPLFQVQFASLPEVVDPGTGLELPGGVRVADVVSATVAPSGIDAIFANHYVTALWGVGALAVGVGVALSLALYVGESTVERRLPVDPVRLMGVLIGAGAVAFGAASYQVYATALPGTPVPVGVVVLAVLSAVLLTVDRTDRGAEPRPEGA
jgi:uncharacterized protein (TIGR04206 family)